jgi:hypothetical protein
MLRMDLIEDGFNSDVRFVVFEFVVLDKVMRDVLWMGFCG